MDKAEDYGVDRFVRQFRLSDNGEATSSLTSRMTDMILDLPPGGEFGARMNERLARDTDWNAELRRFDSPRGVVGLPRVAGEEGRESAPIPSIAPKEEERGINRSQISFGGELQRKKTENRPLS